MDDDAILLAIGRLEGKMDGIGREIGDLKNGIQTCQSNCAQNRDKVSKRIGILEDFRAQVLAYAVVASVIISVAGNWILQHLPGGAP